jgi:hypothetical protein
MATQEEYHAMSDSDKKKEDWMNSKWRPMMGWMYMVVCMFDFVLFPVMWSMVQALAHGAVNVQWQPITLQGAGLFHIAMGAIIGVSAYGRTQEKLQGANNGGLQVGTTYTPPAPVQSSGFGSSTPAPAPAFGSTPAPSFGSTAPAFGSSAPSVNTSGQKVVPQSSFPAI